MIEILLTYKYALIIPLAIIEGPIIAVVCGFLVTLKVFNIFLVYLVIVLGDIVGDGIFYYIGHSGKRLLRYFKVTEEKMEKIRNYFHHNHIKAIVMSKLVHGVGFTGLITAGASHVPYRRYLKTCVIISIVQSALMLVIGILFGNTYVVIGKYLNYYAAGASVIVLLILLVVFIRKYKVGTKTTL
ncbi:hypothetical protein A2917_02235 [Candidatus Nomurabacteria bacterium RIFCSPLOWO2_01_FULL_42_17]|uniref:VTT domain-containing protein n=1 Tax=Candidatus Nomurabacteria bacterium RIFCSPLOWO2_01_FULL_42_17 TaxID=1801780 RepID=A0A1F6XMN6_9BACT|nr:MAG: hypothetical protein A2917_02235 [Candidatus Nomurabacteria bacterium RIFCSPLOWO2_01_FULL_42_17]